MRTVLGFSSGAIPTILTGVPPARNGHWNLFYYDPKNSPFQFMRWFRWLPGRMLDNRYARKIIQQLGRRVLGMGPLFECCVSPRLLPYFDWVEKKNVYDPGGIMGAKSIFDELAEAGVPYRVYSYHHFTDALAIRQAREDVANSDARFFFIYLSEMDAFLHMHCHETAALNERLDWYQSQLRELYALARNIDPDAGFSVLSDHGMTPVTKKHDLVGDIERLKLRMPEDFLSSSIRRWHASGSSMPTRNGG
jgi:predicted AlkP superfamily pyrophosphatase or phosphodiesterase